MTNDRRSSQFSLRGLMAFTLVTSIFFGFGKYFGFEPAMWFGQVLGLLLMALGLYSHDSQFVARGFGMFAVFLGSALSCLVYRPAYDGGSMNFVRVVYWGIFPGLPFVLLGLVALVRGERAMGGWLFGALAGALMASAIPYGLMWHASKNYSGGGADIGMIFLLFALPLYLPMAMALGAGLGAGIERLLKSPSGAA